MEKKIEIITKQLLEELGENPEREGLLKTPTRVAKAWEFFSLGYNQKLDDIINQAIFKEDGDVFDIYAQDISDSSVVSKQQITVILEKKGSFELSSLVLVDVMRVLFLSL